MLVLILRCSLVASDSNNRNQRQVNAGLGASVRGKRQVGLNANANVRGKRQIGLGANAGTPVGGLGLNANAG